MRKCDILAAKYPRLNILEMKILLCVGLHGGCCMADVSRLCDIPAKKVEFSVQKMSAENTPKSTSGLIICQLAAADLRKYQLHLSPEGKEVVKLIQGLADDLS